MAIQHDYPMFSKPMAASEFIGQSGQVALGAAELVRREDEEICANSTILRF